MPVPRGNSIALNGGRKEKGYIIFFLGHKLATGRDSAALVSRTGLASKFHLGGICNHPFAKLQLPCHITALIRDEEWVRHRPATLSMRYLAHIPLGNANLTTAYQRGLPPMRDTPEGTYYINAHQYLSIMPGKHTTRHRKNVKGESEMALRTRMKYRCTACFQSEVALPPDRTSTSGRLGSPIGSLPRERTTNSSERTGSADVRFANNDAGCLGFRCSRLTR